MAQENGVSLMMQVPLTGLGMETLTKLIEDAKDVVEVTVYDCIPAATKRCLERMAEERGFRLLVVEPTVRIDIVTKADLEAQQPKWVNEQ